MDHRRVKIIIPDAELLPHVHPIDLLPQGPVIGVVKIEAPDEILSAFGVRVRFHHGPQPLPDRQQIHIVQLMLPFMPVVDCFHRFFIPLPAQDCGILQPFFLPRNPLA